MLIKITICKREQLDKKREGPYSLVNFQVYLKNSTTHLVQYHTN